MTDCPAVWSSFVTSDSDPTFETADPGVSAGAILKYSCHIGYSVKTQDSRTCTNGEWIPGGPPECTKETVLISSSDVPILLYVTVPLAVAVIITLIVIIIVCTRISGIKQYEKLYKNAEESSNIQKGRGNEVNYPPRENRYGQRDVDEYPIDDSYNKHERFNHTNAPDYRIYQSDKQPNNHRYNSQEPLMNDTSGVSPSHNYRNSDQDFRMNDRSDFSPSHNYRNADQDFPMNERNQRYIDDTPQNRERNAHYDQDSDVNTHKYLQRYNMSYNDTSKYNSDNQLFRNITDSRNDRRMSYDEVHRGDERHINTGNENDRRMYPQNFSKIDSNQVNNLSPPLDENNQMKRNLLQINKNVEANKRGIAQDPYPILLPKIKMFQQHRQPRWPNLM